MKKRFLFMLVCLTSTVLVACSSSDKNQKSNQSNDDEVAGEDAQTGNDSQDAEPEAVTIEETTVVDQDDVVIVVKGLEYDTFGDPEVKIHIENNRDENITVQVRKESVNGYMTSASLSADVGAGKKADSNISFLSSWLARSGVDVIAEIQLSFHIFNDDDTILDTELLTLQTSADDTYEEQNVVEGAVVYEENGIKISYLSDIESDETECWFLIENDLDKEITVQIRDSSVNEYMMDGSFSSDVTAGNKAVHSLSFLESSFEESGIDIIQTLELKFHIFDDDDTIVDTELITIK